MAHNLHNTLREFKLASGRSGRFYSLPALEQAGVGAVSRLPVSIRIVLESVLRNCDGKKVSEAHVKELANWSPTGARTDEIPFVVARVVLQDFTGVPLLADLAAMRNVAADMGKNAKAIEPLVPVDLVVDHSVMVDYFRRPDALELNMKLEFKRNAERYQFMKWGMQAFDTFKVVPPGIGIVHQVNLEYLARGVHERDGIYYPDTLVGTDSHTTMINGIGVVAWGVGGIEAEAGMLGQPVYFLTPDVVGVELTGKLNEGITATDLVLTVTEMLRREKVVGKFVEFFGAGTASLAVPDRATIANMAPEYGATMGFFPIDDATIDYLTATGRTPAEIDAFASYFKAQGLFGVPKAGEIDYTKALKLDLSSVKASLAGPKRPQDRIELGSLKSTFTQLFSKPVAENGFAQSAEKLSRRYATSKAPATATADAIADVPGNGQPRNVVEMVDNHPTPDRVPAPIAKAVEIGNGDVLIAAITSCTNTSNPSVLLAAGLLAKKAVEKGLTVQSHVKTSLAPGSRVVTDYLTKAGLLPYLDKLGFSVAAYGCTTCIGNAGDLAPEFNEAITGNDLVCAAVLSGNRNFEARIHPNLRANFLASPPLVVAYAIAGTVLKDLATEPLGQGTDGPVYLKDIWPTSHEIAAVMAFREESRDLSRTLRRCRQRESAVGHDLGRHRPGLRLAPLDLHREAAVFRRIPDDARQGRRRAGRARARNLRRFGDDRPHQPGGLDQADLARRRLSDRERRFGRRFQQLRLAPRQPRGDAARHVRQRADQEPDAAAARRRHARGRRRHAVPAVRREAPDLRRRDALHRARHADRRLRRRGVRHRIVARLGGQGHAAPRRARGDREELRADPSLEPGRHGRAALPVQGQRFGRLARHQGRRDVRHHRNGEQGSSRRWT